MCVIKLCFVFFWRAPAGQAFRYNLFCLMPFLKKENFILAKKDFRCNPSREPTQNYNILPI